MSTSNPYKEIYPDPKPEKREKKKGKAKAKLSIGIYERDGERCAICCKYVKPGQIPHHIIPKSDQGSDVEENEITLGNKDVDFCDCHYQFHHAVNGLTELITRALKAHGLKRVVQYILLGVIQYRKMKGIK